jgi:hypothetical protein
MGHPQTLRSLRYGSRRTISFPLVLRLEIYFFADFSPATPL